VKSTVIAIVVAGLALAVLIGLSRGFDARAFVMLVLLFAFGAFALAVVGRSGSGEVGPARCPSCGGLVSPNAPRCKHCGAPLEG
jgi:hypothetical protein